MIRLKHIILPVFIVSLCIVSKAQGNKSYETNPDRKRTFNWLFGDSIWLDYRANPPVQKSGSRMFALESASVYSDTSGKLMLYSDGKNVWSSNHKIIVNGTGLNGDSSSSQGCLFIPQPGNDSIVYLFTTDKQGLNNGFCVSKIRINPNIDSSIVLEKNVLLRARSCESISATKHANGIWTWVAVHDISGTGMNSFLITEEGVNMCGVYSEGGFNFIYDGFSCQSKSAFSNDGEIYAISAISASTVELLKFDNTNGIFKRFYGVYAFVPTSVNFSKDNKYCYITERDFRIFRITAKVNNANSELIDDHNDSFMIIGARFNPYNQLMINIHDSFFLGRIDHPEQTNVQFIKKGLSLPKMATNELPNFDNSYYNTLGVNFRYKADCSSRKVNFTGLDTLNANTYLWRVKKPLESIWTVAGNSKIIDYSFSDTGLFQVQFIASNSNLSDTLVKSILIGVPVARNFLGRDTGYCVGSFPSILLQAPDGMQCIRWNNDSSGQSLTVNKAGQYIATVTTASVCQMSDTINLYEDSILLKPIITRKGDSLMTSSKGVKFIWYRNNVVVGHTKNIKIAQTGIYKLKVLGNGGCPVESDTFGVYKLSIEEMILKSVSIRPNPTDNLVTVNGLDASSDYHCVLTDMQGRILMEVKIKQSESAQIPTSELSAGIYTITLIDNQQNRKTLTVIKQ